jgi:phosphatidylserine decarboxylase
MPIQFWNRKLGRLDTESVYGGAMVELLYGNPTGFFLTDSFLSRRAFSLLYGGLQSTSWSARKVEPFVKRFGIKMEEFEPGPFRSFNDFFIRRFRAGARTFPTQPGEMGAFAEARYLAFANVDHTHFPVKGLRLAATDLLGQIPGIENFYGGPCLLARLCPVDYHRFHYPDNGRSVHSHQEHGRLHSVNPVALERKPDLFLGNEREITLLETENFGRLAFVEVGALCVGKIVQTHPFERPFRRGGEKGYFLFGGSTVIVYGERDRWIPSEDLLANSAKGLETLVQLGDVVAKTVKKE